MEIKEFYWQKQRREMMEAASKQTKEKLAPMLKAFIEAVEEEKDGLDTSDDR